MRLTAGALLLAIACALCLTGCATDEGDRAFFNDGWTRPEEGAEKRMNSSTW